MLKEPRTLPRDTNCMSITVDTKGKVGIIDIVLNTNTQYKEHVAKLIVEVEK